MKLAVWRR